jgi:hypothetical protein
MLVDKQPNTVPAFMGRLIEFFRWLSTPPPKLQEDDTSDWYKGLCVDPHGFSEQLGKLQISLSLAESSVKVSGTR